MATQPDWNLLPAGQLALHIEASHHAYLHRELPLIESLLLDGVRRYWRQHPEFARAHSLFAKLHADLEQHLIQEETAGFPLLRAHDRDAKVDIGPFANTIDSHIAVHAGVTRGFEELRACLWDYKVPGGVGPEAAGLFTRLEALAADLAEHIHLENDMLFPMVVKRAQRPAA